MQFPLHLEPAVSIKKAQGKSLNSAGVDLKNDCFSDVQSYAACTQVRRAGQSMCTYMPLHDIPDGIWRIKTNDELDKLTRHKNIINYIKAQRLSWFGHLHRMPEERMVKKYINRNRC